MRLMVETHRLQKYCNTQFNGSVQAMEAALRQYHDEAIESKYGWGGKVKRLRDKNKLNMLEDLVNEARTEVKYWRESVVEMQNLGVLSLKHRYFFNN